MLNYYLTLYNQQLFITEVAQYTIFWHEFSVYKFTFSNYEQFYQEISNAIATTILDQQHADY